jgi:hypothetical protein
LFLSSGMKRVKTMVLAILSLALPLAASAQGAGAPVYRCPGNPVLYTDALSAKEAKDKGCRTLEGAPITVIQGPAPKAKVANTALAGSAAPAAGSGSAASRPAEARVDPADQKARDTDSKRILAAELRKEEERLAALQKEFNAGEPERRGDERNYQKYIERVAELKASIARKEGDIVSIKREIAKLPQ